LENIVRKIDEWQNTNGWWSTIMRSVFTLFVTVSRPAGSSVSGKGKTLFAAGLLGQEFLI